LDNDWTKFGSALNEVESYLKQIRMHFISRIPNFTAGSLHFEYDYVSYQEVPFDIEDSYQLVISITFSPFSEER
jgi:hypothetical protein